MVGDFLCVVGRRVCSNDSTGILVAGSMNIWYDRSEIITIRYTLLRLSTLLHRDNNLGNLTV